MQPEPNLEQILNQGMNGAQQAPDPGAVLGFIVVVFLISLVIGLAIQAVVCFFLSKPLKVVPEQFQLMSPGMVWLLMIPCFALVWNFFVYPKVAKSLRQYAAAQGNNMVGDCGETLGWVYCGLAVACIIPYLNILCGPAAIVLMIIYLVKVNSIAGKLQMAAMQQPTQASVVPPGQPFGE